MGGTCYVNACIQVLASTKFAPLLRPTNEVDVLLQLDRVVNGTTTGRGFRLALSLSDLLILTGGWVMSKIQLKRFRSDDTKICMIMEYPETLDSPFIVPEEDQSHSSSRYTLYGMVVHQGLSIDSGHYYTCVKSNQAWKLINDENVAD
ncbi:unnamed protein product [Didymodactylos carnosus]|uniref:Ubiquitin carboxyl-terminal hydrolase 36 n=1 Tax=Didymodactylos carnosus TaxID=1234261 RepID=A0A8S2ENW6_9BILA|nr:unnamed protein product [Didymodactylos carnosus]CAF4023103.1 unnamed protein product [Didymodactylos carnosus]